MKSTITILTSIGTFLVPILFALVVSVPAMATDRSEPTSPTPISTTDYSSSNENETWKYAVGGAVVACLVLSIWKQRWCWEDKTPEPFPDPGPAVKDVTPSNLSDDGATYIFKGR